MLLLESTTGRFSTCVSWTGYSHDSLAAPPFGKGRWELFNLKADPGETRDLAGENPSKMRELLKGWDEYVLSHGVVWGLGGNPDYSLNPNFAEQEDETADPKAWMSIGSKPKIA